MQNEIVRCITTSILEETMSKVSELDVKELLYDTYNQIFADTSKTHPSFDEAVITLLSVKEFEYGGKLLMSYIASRDTISPPDDTRWKPIVEKVKEMWRPDKIIEDCTGASSSSTLSSAQREMVSAQQDDAAQQDDVSFLANLRDDQRAQVRRMIEASFREGQSSVQQPPVPLARLFIREMDEPAFMELLDDITRRAHAHGNGELWERAEKTLHPSEILRNVVDSFRREQDDSAPCRSASTTWMVQVNGDVQRGKSAVEAFIALVTKLIHDSNLCEDRACTILATQMHAWARALHGNMVRSLWVGEGEGAIEAEGQQESDEDWLSGIPCELLTTTNEDACREAIQQGGLVVLCRSENQISRIAKILRSEMSLMRSLGTAETWPVMLLDESDRMLGSCNSAAIEIDDGRSTFNYERAMNDLLGWEQHLRSPAWQHGWPEQLSPPLVCHISGTNALCFLWMLLRIGLPKESGKLLFRILDVVSFRRPRDASEFVGFSRFERFGGTYLAQLHPADEHVNEQVVEMYMAACLQPHNCLLDCTTSRVNMSKDHNMQTHFEVTLRTIMEQNALLPTGLVAVFVHGGNTTFNGNIGVRFTTGWRLRGEQSPYLQELQRYMRQCASHEPDAQLARELRQAADCIFVHPLYVHTACHSCDGGGYHSIQDFMPLLLHLVGRAYRETGREPEIVHNSRLSTSHLNLLLFMLRHVFPDLPVAIIGHGMVRRCLSIVAVDILQAEEPVPMLAVTHMLIHSNVNGADLAQQFLRPSTTLTTFHERHGIQQIMMLATESVWDIVRAMVAFTEWPQFDTDRAPRSARKLLLRTIEERISSVQKEDILSLLVNEEQKEQMRIALQQFDEGNLDPHALRVAIVISQMLQLPHDPESNAPLFRPLFALMRQPFAGAGCGRMERDLGEAMCIIHDILNDLTPHHYREAWASRRGARQQRAVTDRLGLLIINGLHQLGISGTLNAPAHEYPHPSHPLTEREICAMLQDKHSDLKGQPGYGCLFRASGLGFHLQALSVTAQTPYLARRSRLAAHSTGRRGGRQPYEYWLREDLPLPTAPPFPQPQGIEMMEMEAPLTTAGSSTAGSSAAHSAEATGSSAEHSAAAGSSAAGSSAAHSAAESG